MSDDLKYGYVPSMKEIIKLEKKFNVVSTFSGVGGSSLGYKMAGGNVLAAIEFLDYQAKTYRHNHKGTILLEQDIRKLKGKDILDKIGLKVGELDILDGSPPCSAFSTSGSREKGWGEVKSYGNTKQRVDDLFFEYSRLIREIQPKVFVAENVSGLVKGKAKGYFKEILAELRSCGYNVKAKLLNAKYYGVPQSRQRLIFIGVRNDINKEPVYPTASNTIIPLGLAIKDIEFTDKDREQTDISKYAIYKESLRTQEGAKSKKYLNLVKCSKNKPANTLTQTAGVVGAASIIHWDNRKFTESECKVIASLPKDFDLLGDYRRNVEACGRLVPPLMMKAIAETIYKEILK